MSSFDSALQAELESLRNQGLRRELRRIDSPAGPHVLAEGRTLLNFSSNDYLGLAGHPAVREGALQAVREYGAGAGAARLICGSLAPHHELEEALAAFKQTPAALAFSSGYAAAVGTISALLGPGDVIVIDRLVHACCVDAARLCGATLRVFRHNDANDLERILRWARARTAGSAPGTRTPRILIVTESVFSMDGDLAPLRDIVELKDRHGAWLMLDEAHATGLFGERRCGLAEAVGVADRVEVQMGTLGKALGASGGYIAGSRALIDLLIHRARSFIFSTAPNPAAVGAARAGLQVVSSPAGESLRQTLWQRVDAAKNALIHAGRALAPVQSPIIPIPVGPEDAALHLAAQLRERGLLIPAIRYPTVARGEARLRLTVSAAHSPADIQELGRVFTALPPAPHAPAGPA